VAEFDIIYGKGVSREGCIIDMGIETGILEKSGAWISYNGEKIANGRDKTKDYLSNNPEIATEIEGKIFEKLKENKKV
jgi:recombination protein RecA